MNGIYFVNEKISLKGLAKKQSIDLQKETIIAFIRRKKIRIAKLNPYQLYDHYSIPHALYYDLKREKHQFDCFIIYSQEVIEDYVTAYPARWLMLKSFFHEVITVEHSINQIQI